MFFAGWGITGKVSGGWWPWKRWWLVMAVFLGPAALLGLLLAEF